METQRKTVSTQNERLRTAGLLGALALALLGLILVRWPAAVGWPNFYILTEHSIPNSLRIMAADHFCKSATREDVPILKQLLRSRIPHIRMRALAVLIRFPTDDVVSEAIGLTKDPDKEVRRVAYTLLSFAENTRGIPSLIEGLKDDSPESVIASAYGLASLNAREGLPELVEYLRRNRQLKGFTDAQIRVGRAIATISGQKFNFSNGGLFCGSPLFAAAKRIEDGKKLGGEKGQALIKKGEEELAYWDAHAKKNDVDALVSNVRERDKVISWWDARGSGQFPPN